MVEEVLGNSSGRKPTGDDETWWRHDEVQKAVKAERPTKKKWNILGSKEGKEACRIINKVAKRVTTKNKAVTLSRVYEELETPEGQKDLYDSKSKGQSRPRLSMYKTDTSRNC